MTAVLYRHQQKLAADVCMPWRKRAIRVGCDTTLGHFHLRQASSASRPTFAAAVARSRQSADSKAKRDYAIPGEHYVDLLHLQDAMVALNWAIASVIGGVCTERMEGLALRHSQLRYLRAKRTSTHILDERPHGRDRDRCHALRADQETRMSLRSSGLLADEYI
jgi:hypothetical protein